MLEIVYFTTAAGRSQAIDFMSALQSGEAALVLSDIEAVATHGFRAPASVKTIKGHRPLCEIRTGRYRTFFAILDGRLVVLHICKKQDQQRGIEAAYRRLKETQGG